MRFEKISPVLGARITGADLSRPLGEESFARVEAALHEHGPIGLAARHHYGNRDDLEEGSRTAASALNADQENRMKWVRHAVARPHPRTGVKTLYAVSGSSFAIEGMDESASRALLVELTTHATQSKYCHTYDYQVGDLIVWDNAQLLHKAPLADPAEPRTLWRVTVKESP